MVDDVGWEPAPSRTPGPEPGFSPTPLAALAELLVTLFSSSARLLAFVRSHTALQRLSSALPGDTVPVEAMAFALAVALQEHGLIARELFVGLARARPLRAPEIRRTAEMHGILLAAVPEAPKRPRRRWWPRLAVAASAVVAGGLTVSKLRAPDDGPPVPEVCVEQPPPAERVAAPAIRQPEVAGTVDIPDKIIVEPSRVAFPTLAEASRSAQDTPIIALGQREIDPVVLTVVSLQTGEAWRVSLSRHRTAEYAARDIYAATRLKNDPDIGAALWNDEYQLCQRPRDAAAVRCYRTEPIDRVIDVEWPVHIERRGLPTFEAARSPAPIDVADSKIREPAFDPFRQRGAWDALLRDGDPWPISVMKALDITARQVDPRERDFTFRVTLQICPDGSIKSSRVAGTGERALDLAIKNGLDRIRFKEAKHLAPLLGGRCRKLLHTFTLQRTRGRVRLQ